MEVRGLDVAEDIGGLPAHFVVFIFEKTNQVFRSPIAILFVSDCSGSHIGGKALLRETKIDITIGFLCIAAIGEALTYQMPGTHQTERFVGRGEKLLEQFSSNIRHLGEYEGEESRALMRYQRR